MNAFCLLSAFCVFPNWILIVWLFTMFDRLPYIMVVGQISIFSKTLFNTLLVHYLLPHSGSVPCSPFFLREVEYLTRLKVYTLDLCFSCLAFDMTWWYTWTLLHFSWSLWACLLVFKIIPRFIITSTKMICFYHSYAP